MLSFIPVLALVGICQAAPPRLRLGNTALIGRDVTGLKQDFFGGIPFAEKPLGALRLLPPVLKTRLTEATFDASNFGPACLQPGLNSSAMSEDCLTINVFRPSGLPSTASLPILFWTYGGGFQGGASSQYNGSAIVAQSVARGTPLIYVNFNYRLGPLGYPQGAEADQNGVLNLGLRDQLAALEWVQENIHFFGGDKTKVTLFGESAGSMMTSVLFLHSSIERLARGAIFESGQAASPITHNAERREIDWINFVAGVPHCASIANSGNTLGCLRTANSSEILQGLLATIAKAPELFAFNPTIDGPGGLYPDIASNVIAQGHFARLPFMAGTNQDEGTAFIPSNINSEQTISDIIIANYSPPLVPPEQLASTVQTLLTEFYPNVPALGSPFNTGNQTFGLNPIFKQSAALLGDIMFQSQRRFWSRTLSNAGVKTFGYLFTQPQTLPAFLGVPHGTEIQFVYGTIPANSAQSARTISSFMMEYWISFATSLDPNDGRGIARPHWDQYTPNRQFVLQLNGDNTTMIPDNYRESGIAFINSVPATFHHRRS